MGENQAYVTDGPFVVGKKENTLEMIWSSFTKTAYAIGIAYSESGNIQGPGNIEKFLFLIKTVDME